MARTRPCNTAVYKALVHVDTCTWPYTCRVHGRMHGLYTAVYTSRVRGRVRAMYTAEEIRADGPYTVMYTGGVDGLCARPIHGRVRAVFAGEDVFTGPVHGRRVTGTRHVPRPCTRPVRGRTTAVYTAVDCPYTAV